MGSTLGETVARVEQSLERGLVFEAHGLAVQARQQFPDSLRLAQLHGLALARLGATDRARACLEELAARGHRDPETVGILARVYKDVFKRTGDADYARLSRDTYLGGFGATQDPYLGVNAATLSAILGDDEAAGETARAVVAAVGVGDDYWSLATLGEAHLIAGDLAAARAAYSAARRVAGSDWGNLASTHQQLCFIAQHRDLPADLLRLLQPPAVVAFSGHMVDRPERTEPRFPDHLAEAVKTEIARHLDAIGAGVGYCSAACGGDVLFIEAMLERGAEVNVYLPFCLEDFMRTSVDFAGERWTARVRRALDRVPVKLITEEGYLGTDGLFAFAGDVISGMTTLRASLLGAEPHFLAVLARSRDGVRQGGTEHLLDRWPFPENVHIVDPTTLLGGAGSDGSATRPEEQAIPLHTTASPSGRSWHLEGIERDVRCVLFADVVGFGRRTEQYAPFFMVELLRSVEEGLPRLERPPEILSTWGDALFAACDRPRDLCELAFLLKELFRSTRWSVEDPEGRLDIRIALHAGPVFTGIDPILKRRNAYGTLINHTSRLRPLTLPGCVFASEPFAAALVVETGDLYRCEYVGLLELPEGMGFQDIYHVTRREDFSVLVSSFKRQQAPTEEGAVPAAAEELLPGVPAAVEERAEGEGSFAWLLPHMTAEHFGKDDVLFRKGDRADKVYYLEEGILRLAELGRTASGGDIVGEAALFSPLHERNFSAVCATDVRLHSVSHERMIDFLYRKPAFLLQLMQLCVRRFIANLAETIAEKEKIESELKIARAIQTSMLPRAFPASDRFDLFATMDPAREVGGDFYDFFKIGGHKLGFVIGDVSGKGVPAALFMVVSRTVIRTEALRGLPPAEVLRRANDRLCPENDECMFVTVFCGVLDTATGVLQYSCAGHNPPLLARADGRVEQIPLASSVVLGAMEGVSFPAHSLALAPGELVLLYTDGVTEAENPTHGQLGEGRLVKTLGRLRELAVRDLVRGLRDEVRAFAGEAPQSDDITLLAVRRL